MPDTPDTAGPGAPLAGRSVVVTRAREQAGELARPLEALGAEVLALPVIAIVEPDDWRPADAAIARLEDYDYVVLTSTNAVAAFFERVRQRRGDLRPLASPVIAAVGESTRRHVEDAALEVEIMPRDARAEGLVEEFSAMGLEPGVRVLIPRALKAREILPEALREMGAFVDVVPVYRTVPVDPDREVIERIRQGGVDVFTFTSGSTVKHLIASLERAGLDAPAVLGSGVVASIGPVTTASLERRGLVTDVEASQATMASLADAIAAHFAAQR